MRDFDFLGITIQYEMCYTNILQVLDLGLHSAACERPNRGRSDCDRWMAHVRITRSRLQNFSICFYIGEGETVYDELLDTYKENKKRWRITYGLSGEGLSDRWHLCSDVL